MQLGSMPDLREIDVGGPLRAARSTLASLGLDSASLWCCETTAALVSDGEEGVSPAAAEEDNEMISAVAAARGEPWLQPEESEDDITILGQALLRRGEYRRCHQLLSQHASRKQLSERASFLRLYAAWLAGEREMERLLLEAAGPIASTKGETCDVRENRDAAEILRVIAEEEARSASPLSPFLRYLRGKVLRAQAAKPAAVADLTASVNAFPWNKDAWDELQGCVNSIAEAEDLALPQHWMTQVFTANLALECQENDLVLQTCDSLEPLLSGSSLLANLRATALYNMREFDASKEIFEDLARDDPHRLEGMDTFSNILYVNEAFSELSALAHRAMATDKYRAETCCIIGNYYSLRGQHEKSVIYFKRAMRMNHKYLSAWTLMGHEYLEMKNETQAIQAYRKAVDICPRDYRAWYGLGQVHEILKQPLYALYYFKRAATLRPEDCRMWTALAECLIKHQPTKKSEIIRCYERAVATGDKEGIVYFTLASLYAEMGKTEQAAHYYRLNYERLELAAEQSQGNRVGLGGLEATQTILYLARYEFNQGNLKEAAALAMRVLDIGDSDAGQAKEQARALLLKVSEAHEDSHA